MTRSVQRRRHLARAVAPSLVLLVGLVGPVRGQGPEDADPTLARSVPDDSPRTIGRAKVAMALEALRDLPEVGFFLGSGRLNEAELALAAGGLLADERVARGDDGVLVLRARLPRAKVRDLVLDAVRPERTWAQEPVALEVVAAADGGWGPAEVEAARAAAAATLRMYRLRVAPDAARVLILTGRTRSLRRPDGTTALDAAGTSACGRRRNAAILAELVLESTDAAEPRPGAVPRRPARDGEDDVAARAAVASAAARAAVMGLVQRLAGLPAPAEPREGAIAGSGEEWELHVRGWTEDQVEPVVEALRGLAGGTEWRSRGRLPEGLRVLRCRYAGPDLIRAVEEALREVAPSARVTRPDPARAALLVERR